MPFILALLFSVHPGLAIASPLSVSDLQNIASTSAQTYKLTARETQQMFATINCESGWSPLATSTTEDYGIAQINKKAHPDISMDEMLDPYWSLDYMAQEFAWGHESMWVCFTKLYQR